MLIGYARTSTVDQKASFEAQKRELTEAGCETVFSEQVSAVATKRPELEAYLANARKGDTLVVTKLDRLARSLPDLMDLTRALAAKGVALNVLDLGMDTATPHGEMVLGIIGSVAQFERSLMLERQRVGIARAKAEGKYKGRKPTARAKAEEVLAMLDQGVPATKAAERLGISRSSVERIKREARREHGSV